MGLLEQAESMIESSVMQRLAGGQGNFSDPGSGDHQAMHQLVSQASPQQVQAAFTQSAQQMDLQHLSPANGGGPLASLAKPVLASLASALISHLTGSGGYSPSSLLSSIPGLGTTNPSQMDAAQVANLAQYTRQNHPDLFGAAAAQVGQQQPGLLGSLLGHSGMAAGAAALASHFLGQ